MLRTLHADLQGYLHAGNLDHPLVMIDDFSDPFVTLANRKYLSKLNELERAEQAGDWHKYIWLHERPYRARVLWKIGAEENLSHDHYWRLVRDVWMDADTADNYRWWALLWGSTRPYREQLMTSKERNILNRMPDIVHIYQTSHHQRGRYRLSWKAGKYLTEATIDREQIRAYFSHNRELIVLPRDAKMCKTSQ